MNKKILGIVAIILLVLAVPVTIFILQRQQELRTRAAPATTFSVDPSSVTKSAGENFTVSVKIETGPNLIASADILLRYDPAILDATKIQPGSFLPGVQEIQNSVSTPGRVVYGIYTTGTNAQSGQGVLAIITFKGKASGTSQITFESQSKALGVAEGTNVLSTTNPGSITIVGTTAQPTNTPTPQPTQLPAQPTATPQPASGGGGTTPTNTPTPTTKPVGGTNPKPTLPVTGTIGPTAALVIAGFALVTVAAAILIL